MNICFAKTSFTCSYSAPSNGLIGTSLSHVKQDLLLYLLHACSFLAPELESSGSCAGAKLLLAFTGTGNPTPVNTPPGDTSPPAATTLLNWGKGLVGCPKPGPGQGSRLSGFSGVLTHCWQAGPPSVSVSGVVLHVKLGSKI